MDILSALYVLRTATDDALICHSAETILTLRKVGERLKANLLPSTPCGNASEVSAPPLDDSITTAPSPRSGISAEASSPGDVTASESSSRDGCSIKPSSATTRFSVCNAIAPLTARRKQKAIRGKSRKASEGLVSKLSRGMKRTARWIWDTSNEGPEFIISRKRRLGEDRRLEDIRRVEGDPESSNNDKLLRLLAIRSLATEFTTKQSRDELQTRVDELVTYVLAIEPTDDDQQGDAPRGRGNAVASFVERLPNISSKPLANRAINSGIKHLVFEKVLQHRLREFDLEEICEAVSAILGLNIQNFRTLPYRGMPGLADALLSDKTHISLQDESGKDDKRHILDIMRGVTPWFTTLQAKYNDFASRAFAPEPEKHCAKRSRHIDHRGDLRQSPTHQLDAAIPSVTTTELDLTRTCGREMPPEGQSQCSNDVPVTGTRSSSNGECPPENLDVFESFDPFQDFDCFRDFDPFQDFDPLQEFGRFQDFNPLQDIDFVFPDVPAEIPDTAENIPPNSNRTSQVSSTIPGQDSHNQGGTLFLVSSSNISIPQAAY